MEYFINIEIIDRRVENIMYCTRGNAVFVLGHEQQSFYDAELQIVTDNSINSIFHNLKLYGSADLTAFTVSDPFGDKRL